MRATVVAGLMVSSAASAEIGDNAAGVNVHVPFGAEHLLDKARSLGVGWVRVDGNWELFEGQRDVADVPVERRSPQAPFNEDEYTWEVMDRVVCEASARELSVFMTLAYTPCWAVEGGGVDCSAPNRPYVGFRKPIRGKYEAFVFAAVRHYSAGIDCGGGRRASVTHFGMWNEANLEQFYERGDVVDYANRVLVPGARAVKAACPTCKVLGPDLANVGEADVKLEAVLCDPAARQAIDILTHHSYQSFPELGLFIWDGDSYDNVLDEQRFVFTRRSVRQIMESCQATDKEVWMTETGRRAPGSGPSNNPTFAQGVLEEQATYVELVLRAQARRPWVTNTFIYEIADDTLSDIDGYGLWRCDQSMGLREPCFEKPAARSIRAFIDAHPEFSQEGPPPTPACANGQDDDEDGLVDFPADPGCASATDGDEFNPAPPRTLEVFEAGVLQVDGVDDEYGQEGAVLLSVRDFEAADAPSQAPGPGDLSASIRVRLVGDRVGIFVDVSDDVHDNDRAPGDLWQGDSLQIAVDPERDGGEGYSGRDLELGFALIDGQVRSTAFFGAMPQVEGPVIRRSGNLTRYELSLPEEVVFGRRGVGAGDEAAVSFLINEADRQGREGWLAFGGGIGRFKRPADFARLRVVDRVDEPEPEPESEPEPEAEADPEATPEPEVGPEASPEASPEAEAEGSPDAGAPDGGDPDLGEPEGEGEGGEPEGTGGPVGGGQAQGCQTGAGRVSPGWLLWSLVGALAWRRRRSRVGQGGQWPW